MTKQDIIREGIESGIRTQLWVLGEDKLAKSDFPSIVAKAITCYLQSQGVVRKVERELPLKGIIKALDIDISDRRGLKWEWGKIDEEIMAELKSEWTKLLKKQLAGYEAVEPLVGD